MEVRVFGVQPILFWAPAALSFSTIPLPRVILDNSRSTLKPLNCTSRRETYPYNIPRLGEFSFASPRVVKPRTRTPELLFNLYFQHPPSPKKGTIILLTIPHYNKTTHLVFLRVQTEGFGLDLKNIL